MPFNSVRQRESRSLVLDHHLSLSGGRDKLKNQWVQSFAKIVHTFFHDETGLGATDQRFKALLYGPVEPADQDHWTDGGTTKLGTVKSPYTVVDQLSIRANHAAQETVVGREEEMHHLVTRRLGRECHLYHIGLFLWGNDGDGITTS